MKMAIIRDWRRAVRSPGPNLGVRTDRTGWRWAAVLEQARNNQLDLPGIMSTPERKTSQPSRYLPTFPIVILAHEGGAKPRSLKFVRPENCRGEATRPWALRTYHPDLNLV